MKLPIYRPRVFVILLCALFIRLVPADAQQTTAPDLRAILGGTAPIRVLLTSGHSMLAWKGTGPIQVVNTRDGATLYAAPADELVGIVRATPGTDVALRKGGENFCPVPGMIRLQSDKPIQLWTPTPDTWTTSTGSVFIVPTPDGRFSVVREMLLEDYLRHVVPAEMPSSFHPQALRAQAIIARTYTLQQLGRHAVDGADLCGTVHCQAFATESRRTKATDDAVIATKGLILLYGDDLAHTYYHSNCGGVSDDAGAVWGPEFARPYLTGVSDFSGKPLPKDATITTILHRRDQYEKHAGNLRWEKRFSAQDVNTFVQKNLARVTGDATVTITTVTNLAIEERTPAGRAATLRVEGDGASVLVHGDKIRWLFGTGQPGPEGLWSTLFDLKVTRDPAGTITEYIFTGAGRGHGLGLCQWGADGRAKAGQNYREILQAYYPGTRLASRL